MRNRNPRQTSELYREKLSNRARHAAASIDRFIEQSLAEANNRFKPIRREHIFPHTRPEVTELPTLLSDAELTNCRTWRPRQVLERHGVQPNAPIRDLLKADLELYFWLQKSYPSCSPQIHLSLKKAQRSLTGCKLLSGGYVNQIEIARERDFVSKLMLKWLGKKRVMLILMAHSCGLPAAASSSSGTPFSRLPLKILLVILKHSL